MSSVEFCDAKFQFDDDKKKKEKPKDRPEPEPVKNPILTVTKEMFICSKPNIIGGSIDCFDDSGTTIPDPDSDDWISWDDCTETNFCPFFDEADFLMQIEQNSGPNFIRFEFPGNSNGRSVIVESGTFQVTEEGNFGSGGQCQNTNYEGRVTILHVNQGAGFCFTLEDDCSGTIQAGEEKTCTVKNYLIAGGFGVPQTNGATIPTGTTSQSNNVIPTTTTTTQSSNAVGAPQSSNIVNNTFSSSPSSTLVNILPSNPN